MRHSAFRYFASIQDKAFTDESFIVLRDDVPLCSAVRVDLGGQIGFFDQPFRLELSSAYFREDKSTYIDELLLKAIWGGRRNLRNLTMDLPAVGARTNRLLESLLPFATRHKHYVEGYVDLTESGPDFPSNLRKSHRHEIRKTEPRLDEVRTHYGEIDDAVFDAFQDLHLEAAGKVTRPKRSWDEQKFAIEERRASLTTVSFRSEIVGATFSWLASSSGLYGTGAYDRTKFSQISISHVSLFRAIEHARSVGARHYILGEVLITGGDVKQRNIANFKRGFSKTRQHFHRLLLCRT